MDQAREAMRRREYGTAAPLLRAALAARPDDLEAHYRLGVTASHLDQAEEASREFEWVLTHGDSAAPEVQIARDWLASRVVGTRATVGAPPAAREEPIASRPDTATVSGRAVGPDGIKPRLQLFLKGVPGTPVQDEYHVLRTDHEGHFRFTNVVSGEYMLTDVIAGAPTWRLRVSAAKGERLTLDLSPANLASVRDDFPTALSQAGPSGRPGIESRR